MPGPVACNNRHEVLTRHLGPMLLEEKQLCVGQLEHQEVAQPALAGGADEHVGVRDVRREQPLRYRSVVDLLRVHLTRHRLLCQLPASPSDVAPATIAHADVEAHATATRRALLEALHCSSEIGGQRLGVRAEEADADVQPERVLAKSGHLLQEEAHHGADLLRTALPVLRRKRKDGECLHAELGAPVDEVAQSLAPRPVAAEWAAVLAPPVPSVAVHDHGYVAWDRALIAQVVVHCIELLVSRSPCGHACCLRRCPRGSKQRPAAPRGANGA
mmetsp:Transcript_97905/g.260071  ORF Transcript_97905/g.260071 Transcript_97905/m.260071 type:complete len:273 (-) Transcript_97905:153-971(-)